MPSRAGLPNIDVGDWQANTKTDPRASPKVVQNIAWFWEVVRSFSSEQQARLLQFTTGTAGVPVGGMGNLQGTHGQTLRFELTFSGTPQTQVVGAHTCFNRLDLPVYSSKAEMEEALRLVLLEDITGFNAA